MTSVQLKNPVTLEQIKKDKRLANMVLVRIGKLSVQPVTEKEWGDTMELVSERLTSLPKKMAC